MLGQFQLQTPFAEFVPQRQRHQRQRNRAHGFVFQTRKRLDEEHQARRLLDRRQRRVRVERALERVPKRRRAFLSRERPESVHALSKLFIHP